VSASPSFGLLSGLGTRVWLRDCCDISVRSPEACLSSLATGVHTPLVRPSYKTRSAGSHWLAVESGRHAGAALHRSQRLCQRCDSGEVDDEAHMVFRCAALSGQRREHASLFSPWPESLRSFMRQDPKTLAAFAYACYKKEKELKTCNLSMHVCYGVSCSGVSVWWIFMVWANMI